MPPAVPSAELYAEPSAEPSTAEERRALKQFASKGSSSGESEVAFRILYRRHTPFLFALALRMCDGRRAEAEDALQEAWIRAAEKIATFRGVSALRTWLAGFVVNCCREQRRRPRPVTEDRQLAAPETGIAGPSSARIDLERHLSALPPKLRDVLVLHDIQGFTHREVGHLLEIPGGTSKRRLFDARRTLRQRLDGALEGTPRNRAGDRL